MRETYIALLRGINVGGKNSLPMKDLARIVADAGAHDVQTYIQSGNVVCQAEAAEAERLPGRIAELIAERAGLRVPVVLRSRPEWEAAASGNPFLAEGVDPAFLSAMFLADWPKPEDVSRLDRLRSPGDAYRVIGREIYLHCPRGLADTKLTNDYFDRTLKTISTSRNWRTILKLQELAQAR